MPDMFTPLSVTELADRLAGIRARDPEARPETVAEVVRAVLGSMAGDLSARDVSLLGEVEELGRVIAAAKTEIASLRVDDITGRHIPSATDELDAIVAHTASATNDILEACETLDQVGNELVGAPAEALQGATTRIYEACSFQDITGQRITKVVATLKTIEGKIAHILAAFGTDMPAGPIPEAAPAAEDLLNGPQLPNAAMMQSEIDRLLASFD
jgi:chemotaxis protein CheZ